MRTDSEGLQPVPLKAGRKPGEVATTAGIVAGAVVAAAAIIMGVLVIFIVLFP